MPPVFSVLDAFLFVAGVWNAIAFLTGETLRMARQDLSDAAEGFRAPSWAEVFLPLGPIRYLAAQARILAEMVRIVAGHLEDWRAGVVEIIRRAQKEDRPMPPALRTRLIRADVAANQLLDELIRVGIDTSESDRGEIFATIIEVADAGAVEPLSDEEIDPSTDVPTIKQRLWRTFVDMLVTIATAILPLAIAYAAAVWYLKLWEGEVEIKTLAQDSRRVRIHGHRHRKNRKKGPDK